MIASSGLWKTSKTSGVELSLTFAKAAKLAIGKMSNSPIGLRLLIGPKAAAGAKPWLRSRDGRRLHCPRREPGRPRAYPAERIQENVAMAKSGLIEPRRAAGEAGRRPWGREEPDTAASRDPDHRVSLNIAWDGGGKIVRLYPLYPRSVAFQKNPPLSKWDKKSEYNVIRFSQVASVKSRLQRGRQTATPEIVTNCNGRGNDDHHQRMRVNAFAAAVLVVLVISGEWIFSTLATVH